MFEKVCPLIGPDADAILDKLSASVLRPLTFSTLHVLVTLHRIQNINKHIEHSSTGTLCPCHSGFLHLMPPRSIKKNLLCVQNCAYTYKRAM
jgi:hypothetical protein